MNESQGESALSRIGGCYFGTEEDRRNQRYFTSIAVLWAASYVGAKTLLESDGALAPLVQWLAIGVPNLLAAAGLLIYLRFLLRADELVRKVELEGLAVGFGVGVIVGLGYPLFEFAGAPELKLKYLLALMMLSWVAGHLVAWKRYLL